MEKKKNINWWISESFKVQVFKNNLKAIVGGQCFDGKKDKVLAKYGGKDGLTFYFEGETIYAGFIGEGGSFYV